VRIVGGVIPSLLSGKALMKGCKCAAEVFAPPVPPGVVIVEDSVIGGGGGRAFGGGGGGEGGEVNAWACSNELTASTSSSGGGAGRGRSGRTDFCRPGL